MHSMIPTFGYIPMLQDKNSINASSKRGSMLDDLSDRVGVFLYLISHSQGWFQQMSPVFWGGKIHLFSIKYLLSICTYASHTCAGNSFPPISSNESKSKIHINQPLYYVPLKPLFPSFHTYHFLLPDYTGVHRKSHSSQSFIIAMTCRFCYVTRQYWSSLDMLIRHLVILCHLYYWGTAHSYYGVQSTLPTFQWKQGLHLITPQIPCKQLKRN